MLVVQVLREFAVEEFFSPTSRLTQESEGFFFFRRATYKVTYLEAVESAKEGGLSPQEGDVKKKKKKKRPSKARRWLPQRQGSVCPQPIISFFVHEYLGSERPVLFEYQLLRDLVYEEAMCKGRSGNGLPYTAKAVP